MKVFSTFLKLIFVYALLSIYAYMHAAPACPDTFNINQPDGTNISILLRGDEWFHWNTTVDNVPVVKNEKGIYEYAVISEDTFVPTGKKAHNLNERDNTEREYISNVVISNSQRSLLSTSIRNSKPKSNPNGAKSLQTPNTTGTLRYVTILMQFPDRPLQHGSIQFDSLLNIPNYTNYGNHGSVYDYYKDNSCEQLTTLSTVVGPYTAQHNSAYYSTGEESSGIGYSHVRELVQEAVNASKNDVNYAICDNNDDGYVDLVHIVFAGYGAEIGAPTLTIWSHRWVLQNDITDDGKIIHDYIITPELNSYPGTEICAIGTICHELGHTLGAPDFYDKNPDNGNGQFKPMGQWDVMDVGSHNDDRHCPAMHNPYTISQIFHWRDVQNIIKKITPYTLLPIENSTSQKYYRLNTSTSGEYFLLENRKKTGWDSSVLYYSDGLLIYHIHKDIATTSSHDLNDLHPLECYIVSSSATSEPNSTPSSYGSLFTAAYPGLLGNKMFFDSLTTPKAQSWAGDAVNIGLNYIRKEGNNIVFNTRTYIDGAERLCESNQYSIVGIPSSATVSWSYETTIQQIDTFPVLLLSNTNALTTIAQIGSYYTYNNYGLPTNEYLYSGYVTLKATVTYNGVTKVYTKEIFMHEDESPTIPAYQRRKIGLNETRLFCIDNCTGASWNQLKWVITLPSATSPITYYGWCWSITAEMLVVPQGTMNIKLYNLENCDPTLYTDYNIKISYLIPVPDPSLSFANPVTTGAVDITITDRNYAQRDGAAEVEKREDIDYTLELWSENSRTVRTVNGTLKGEKDVVTLDVSNLPNGIYFLTIKVDNEILTTEKMIINH